MSGLYVLPPRGAIEGMGIRAEPYIRFTLPVLQIMGRLSTGAGEIGDFIAMYAVGVQHLDGGLVKVCDCIVGGNIACSVAIAAEKDFRTETAVFIDFEHVDGEVGDVEPQSRSQAFARGGFG